MQARQVHSVQPVAIIAQLPAPQLIALTCTRAVNAGCLVLVRRVVVLLLCTLLRRFTPCFCLQLKGTLGVQHNKFGDGGT